jgi:hypothetical protein
MIPAHAIDDDIRSQLAHPLPPSQMGNYYDTVKGEFVRNPDCLITERAWNLYQEFRCWGRPWWVIQGTRGGHKRWFSDTEQKLLKFHNLPSDPPAPGDLPYAPFDARVMAAIAQHDRLRGREGTLTRKREIDLHTFRATEADEAKAFRKQLVEWLGAQVADVGGDVHRSLLALDAPRGAHDPRDVQARQEAAEQSYIESGRVGGS